MSDYIWEQEKSVWMFSAFLNKGPLIAHSGSIFRKMNRPPCLSLIDGVDIYLVDQIVKGRYQSGQRILDAGAGGGRNLSWFFSEGFEIHACDIVPERETLIRERNLAAKFHWQTCGLDSLPYEDGHFDHVICNAVLHFAENVGHFKNMWHELLRVTKAKGAIFIRTCSDIGIEDRKVPLGDGRFLLPDGSERFLMTRQLIDELLSKSPMELLEPVKSVNVSDQRVMTTLVMVKVPE